MAQVKTIRKNVELLQTIPGVGPHSASLIMAEIGDVRRFKNKKALVAFAGVDAPPFQSGTFESKSRHVSKRGSPHLRRTLFIISSVILQLSHEDNPVFCFMDKKRSEGKHFYVYIVVGAAKCWSRQVLAYLLCNSDWSFQSLKIYKFFARNSWIAIFQDSRAFVRNSLYGHSHR